MSSSMNENMHPIRARLPGPGYRKATARDLPLARPPVIQRAEEEETGGGSAGELAGNAQSSAQPGEANAQPITPQQVADAVYRLMMEDLRRERERRARR